MFVHACILHIYETYINLKYSVVHVNLEYVFICQVRERCRVEWAMFQNRFIEAEKSYYESKGIDVSNYSTSLGGGHIHSRKFDVEGDRQEGNPNQEGNRNL